MRWFVALGLCAVASCSLSIRGPDSRRPPNSPPQCDTSAPGRLGLDTVAGAILLVPLLAVLGLEEGQCQTEQGCDDGDWAEAVAGVALLSLPTAIYWGSAIVGYRRTRRCREAVKRYHQQLMPPPPRQWGPPSQP